MPDNSGNNRLESILEAVDAAIVTIDNAGIVIDCNGATSRLFGYARSELVGRNVSVLMPEPYQSNHDQYIADHLASGVNRIIGIGRRVSGRHSDGRIFPVHLSVAKYEENGETFFAGILHDLSELDQAHSIGSRLGMIVEESINEVYSFDSDSLQLTSVNRAGLENLGYSMDQLLQQSLTDLVEITAPELHQLTAPLLAREQRRASLSTTLKRADGSLYEADISLHLSDAVLPAELIAIAQDTTERNRLLKSLHHTQRMESIGNLTGGIAHDFNNILTVVSANLELLTDDLQDQPDALELVSDAADAAEMGARLTKRLLAFARRSPLTPSRINVNTLIVDLSEMLSRTLGSAVALENRLADDVCDVCIDVSEFENALVNLVINARDAMPEGGRLVISTDNCQLRAEELLGQQNPAGHYTRISVTDTGEGIPKHIRDSIFEPFVTSKKDGKGSGLGLSMVYGFVTQSGGYIDVNTRIGQGTRFSLYLPREAEAADDDTTLVNPDSTTVVTGSKILVAEDDDCVRKVVIKRLEKLGHNVLEAADGYRALELFRQHPDVDLVFSDITMTEGMTGYDLALAVRELAPSVPVLLTSGYAEDIVKAEKLNASGLSLLSKPYDQDELEQALMLALAQAVGAIK